ncbi:MAG TPA: carbonic anhydrase [Solirubrobacteraceae bacterium]|jgi:carbonic anhydrase|nr:carbonic anhydrase [Solirubrobacteraceae bacterium]
MPAEPAKRLAIVACMDARVSPLQLLGLGEGDAHVIRNAGGIVTDDVIRSLAISQRALGTTELAVIHHTQCGMHGFDDHEFRARLQEETGASAPWSVEGLSGAEEGVREAVSGLRTSPLLTNTASVRGYVYDVDTRELHEVVCG